MKITETMHSCILFYTAVFLLPKLAISTAPLLLQQSVVVTRAAPCSWCILFTVHARHHLHETGLCYQQGM